MRVFLSEHCTCGADPKAASGPLFAEGAAMLRALAADAARVEGVEVVVTWAAGLEPFGVPGVEVVAISASPSPTGGAFGGVFAELSAESDATLHVAPETDDLLAVAAERAIAAGGNWLGCSPAAVRRCGDKEELEKRLPAGVRRPPRRAEPFGATSGRRVPFPHVLKPRFGAGGAALLLRHVADTNRGPARAAFPAAVAAMLPGDTPAVRERYVPGRPLSVAVLGAAPLPAGEQHIQITGAPGRLSYHGGTVPAAGVDAAAVNRLVEQVYAAVPGLRGWWGIDFVLPDEPFEKSRDPVLIEVNPRLTTSLLGYRALTDDNLAERVLFPDRDFPPVRWKAGAVRFTKTGVVSAAPA